MALGARGHDPPVSMTRRDGQPSSCSGSAPLLIPLHTHWPCQGPAPRPGRRGEAHSSAAPWGGRAGLMTPKLPGMVLPRQAASPSGTSACSPRKLHCCRQVGHKFRSSTTPQNCTSPGTMRHQCLAREFRIHTLQSSVCAIHGYCLLPNCPCHMAGAVVHHSPGRP